MNGWEKEVRSQESGFRISRSTLASMSRVLAGMLGLIILAGCGSSSSTTTTTTTTPVANTIPVTVNSGPANTAVNMAYVTVQVCNPGSTTVCATIPNVQVDTGSAGLRILASAAGVSGLNLTPVMGQGTPVNECMQFADGNYIWGPVELASVSMAGENASSVPIQIIASGNAPSSVSCAAGGSNLNTSATLQANGILGVGNTIQDCGLFCSGGTVLPYYWLCSSGTCGLASIQTAAQVSNPVAFFNSADNNGVALNMSQAASTGANTASGTLTFGVGTQADNAISSSATVYGLSLNSQAVNSIYVTYNNITYPAYVNASEFLNFFLDPTTVAAASTGAGVSSCPSFTSFYCTGSPVTLQFTAKDNSGHSAQNSIPIGNGTTLWNSSVAVPGGTNAALGNLAGGVALANDEVILGMPFFYGRTVYVGVAGQVPPTGVPASIAAAGYWAF
jgi:hypothetical protein